MISFPASPALNDTYTVGQTTWKWTGTAWQIIARPVAAHKSTHAIGGSDALTPADIGAAEAVHTHAIADTTGLQTALDAKIPWGTGLGGAPVPFADGALSLRNFEDSSEVALQFSTENTPGQTWTVAQPHKLREAIGAAEAIHIHAISDTTGLQTALDAKIPSTEKGAADGVATLDSAGKVPSTQLPSYVDDVIEAANFAALPATGETGKIYVTIDDRKTYRWSGTVYVEISAAPGSTDAVPEGSVNLYYTDSRASAAAPVQSVAGRTGAVTLAKSDVGLGNVDNTSDADKPISTATATALDGKQIKTVYSDTAPSHSPGLEWVDTTELRSYRSYGSLWVEIDRA